MGRIPHWHEKEPVVVPLTFRGVEIGTVQLDEKGNVTGHIREEVPDQLKMLCHEMVKHLSINKD